jgi:hypothetical protein
MTAKQVAIQQPMPSNTNRGTVSFMQSMSRSYKQERETSQLGCKSEDSCSSVFFFHLNPGQLSVPSLDMLQWPGVEFNYRLDILRVTNSAQIVVYRFLKLNLVCSMTDTSQ